MSTAPKATTETYNQNAADKTEAKIWTVAEAQALEIARTPQNKDARTHEPCPAGGLQYTGATHKRALVLGS